MTPESEETPVVSLVRREMVRLHKAESFDELADLAQLLIVNAFIFLALIAGVEEARDCIEGIIDYASSDEMSGFFEAVEKPAEEPTEH